MNDPSSPLADDDLSAALDGEADDALLARIESDPAARERRDQLRAAAELVGAATPPALGPEQVDRLVDRALDAPEVAPARRPGGRGPGPWLVAAVVIVLVAVGLTLVWSGRNSGTEQAADTAAGGDAAAEAIARQSQDAPDAGAAASSGAPATTVAPGTEAAAAPPLVVLGSFESGSALREALAASFPTTDTQPPETTPDLPSAAAVDRCAQQLKVRLSLPDDPLQEGYAVVGGERTLVYEFDHASYRDGSPTTLVAAVGVDACDEVVTFER